MQLIPAPPDCYFEDIDDAMEIISYCRVVAFGISESNNGEQTPVALIVDLDGARLVDAEHASFTFASRQPESIISERRRAIWRESREKGNKYTTQPGTSGT